MPYVIIKTIKAQPVSASNREHTSAYTVENAVGFDRVPFQQSFWTKDGDEELVDVPKGVMCGVFSQTSHTISKKDFQAYNFGPKPKGDGDVWACKRCYDRLPRFGDIKARFEKNITIIEGTLIVRDNSGSETIIAERKNEIDAG